MPIAPARRLGIQRQGLLPQLQVVRKLHFQSPGVGSIGPLLLPAGQALNRIVERCGLLAGLARHLSQLVVDVDIVQKHHGQHGGGIDRKLDPIGARFRGVKEELHDGVELVDRRTAFAVAIDLPCRPIVDFTIDHQALGHALDVFRGRRRDDADDIGAGLERPEGQLNRRTVLVPRDHPDRLVVFAGRFGIGVLGDGIDRFGIIPNPLSGDAGQFRGPKALDERLGVVDRYHWRIALQLNAHVLHRTRVRDALRKAPRTWRGLSLDHSRPARRAQLAGIERGPGEIGNPLIDRGCAGNGCRREDPCRQTRHHQPQAPAPPRTPRAGVGTDS